VSLFTGTSAAVSFVAIPAQHLVSNPASFAALPVQHIVSNPVTFTAPKAWMMRRSGSTLVPVRPGVRVGGSIVWLGPPL
jgi:hypothetical protein